MVKIISINTGDGTDRLGGKLDKSDRITEMINIFNYGRQKRSHAGVFFVNPCGDPKQEKQPVFIIYRSKFRALKKEVVEAANKVLKVEYGD